MSRFGSAIAAAAAIALLAGGSAETAAVRPPDAAAVRALTAPAPAAPLASDRIYFVMTDRYANGDPANDRGGLTGGRAVTGFDPTSPAYFHGGDLEGLTGDCTDPQAGLRRVEELGFDAVWVTPPVVNQAVQGTSAGYHGYWGLDFTRVDPHLGTDADFGAFVACAHRLGMKVIMDVVVNHTADVVRLASSAYSPAPYRDCRGKPFDPARYVGARSFPCLSAKTMPRVPTVPAAAAHLKKPAWLNDPLNYHDRGDIDWGSCSEQCFEQGDFYGLDDLFTEKPSVEQGLADLYADWIARYKLDGFRVDTARHVNAGFFGLWVPQIEAAARKAGVKGFRIFGEAPLDDAIELSGYVRDRGLPDMLDFPFQAAAAGFAADAASPLAVASRLQDDDYFRRPDGVAPAPPTFLGNHDMGRAAQQISQQGFGLAGPELLSRFLLGYDLLYLSRGAPVVLYGDEAGLIGTGGDQQARQDLFPTQVAEWKTQPRLDAAPIQERLRELARLREANPALAAGASIVRVAAGSRLIVSRIGTARRELVEAFNSGAEPATATVQTATPSATWTTLLGAEKTVVRSDAAGKLTLTVPAVGSVLLRAGRLVPAQAPAAPVLKVGPDDLSSLARLTAKVAGAAPVSVAFAVRRGGGAWKRIALDDAPPYRAFLEPARFGRKEQVQLVAIARSPDGRTAVSPVVTTVVPRG